MKDRSIILYVLSIYACFIVMASLTVSGNWSYGNGAYTGLWSSCVGGIGKILIRFRTDTVVAPTLREDSKSAEKGFRWAIGTAVIHAIWVWEFLEDRKKLIKEAILGNKYWKNLNWNVVNAGNHQPDDYISKRRSVPPFFPLGSSNPDLVSFRRALFSQTVALRYCPTKRGTAVNVPALLHIIIPLFYKFTSRKGL